MQLPKSRRRQKLREKKCQYPGCGKIFFGIHISKYCPEHRQDRYRIRKRTKPEDVNIKNQTFKHTYTEVVTLLWIVHSRVVIISLKLRFIQDNLSIRSIVRNIEMNTKEFVIYS